ncbi:MAG TPA: hypothetical protein VFA74_04295 [Terriglobales bacterium]|nr:hypothetical protein [Terriglobales bacterium]
MKNALILFLLVSSALVTSIYAEAKPKFQTATVVSVQKHETPSNYVGDNPSDAPLQSTVYSYDIGIRLNCALYVARYDSAFNYLPSAFTPNQNIEINLQKHVVEVALPGNRDVRMSINRRNQDKDASCMANN